MMEQLTVWGGSGQEQCLSMYPNFVLVDNSFGFSYSGPEPEGGKLLFLR